MKFVKLRIGDIITISEPYMKFMLQKVTKIRTDKINFKPSTWFRKRFFTIVIQNLKND